VSTIPVLQERQSLGYGDYVAWSCDQLGQETVNLMRAAADRSHHLLADDLARQDTARQQLSLVKQAYAEEQCLRHEQPPVYRP